MMFECQMDGCERKFDTKRGRGVHRSRNHENRYEDGEWLRQRYIGDRMNTYEIAEKCGVESETIRRHLERNEIDVRDRSESQKLSWEGERGRRDEYANRMEEIGSSHSITYWDTYSESELEVVRDKIASSKRGEDNPRYGEGVPHPDPITVESTGNVVKSGWEAVVDEVLNSLGVDYRYEKETFPVSDSTYTPDFILGDVVIEVKGFPYQRGVEKALEFVSEYSDYKYVVVGGMEAKDEMPHDVFIDMDSVEDGLNNLLSDKISE